MLEEERKQAEQDLRKIIDRLENHNGLNEDNTEITDEQIMQNPIVKEAVEKLANTQKEFKESLIDMFEAMVNIESNEYIQAHLQQINSTPLEKIGTWLYPESDRDNRMEENIEIYFDEINSFSHIDKKGNTVYNREVKCERKLTILIGLPASGKSTLSNEFSRDNSARIVDSDEVKKLLKEYNNGSNASLVHEESSKITDVLFERCLARGENIVYPKVGANLEKIEADIKKAHDAGYSVNVVYMHLQKNKTKARLLSRFLNTGRWLPLDVIQKAFERKDKTTGEIVRGDFIEETYKACKENKYVDNYEKYSNDVKFGEQPKIMESSNNSNAQMGINDEDLVKHDPLTPPMKKENKQELNQTNTNKQSLSNSNEIDKPKKNKGLSH